MKTAWRAGDMRDGAKTLAPDAGGEPFPEALARLEGFSGTIVVELAGMAPEDCAPAVDAREAEARGEEERRLAALPGLTVAVVETALCGLAATLALACRARVAAPEGAIALIEASQGLVPAGTALWRLRELCGMGEAIGIAVRGARIEAARAAAIGLVDALAPAQVLRDTAAAMEPPARRPPPRLFRTRLGRRLVRRQALGELAARAAPRAAAAAVRLLFEEPSPARAAAAIAELAADPERRQLLRFEHAKAALLGGPRALPRRALVLAAEGGWQWVCALAQRGVRVRWCLRDARALGDGLCWIMRDTERYAPERKEQAAACVSVSEERAGFAGRDLVVTDGTAPLGAAERRHLGRGAVVLVDRGKRAAGPSGVEDAEVAFGYDALTGRTCVLHGRSERAAAFLRGLGFMVLARNDAEPVFRCLSTFETRWRQFREGGVGDRKILGSLQAMGFATRETARRLRAHGPAARATPDIAYELVCAMWRGLQGVDPAAAERIDLALVLETGFPAHRGGPLGFLEQVKARPGVLREIGLADQAGF
ncbi:MAG TPA: hypothetical protein DCM87_16130 [Planctomycetes bacterium]|nr:hypothetical protein [Planctomycetota bacterium]